MATTKERLRLMCRNNPHLMKYKTLLREGFLFPDAPSSYFFS